MNSSFSRFSDDSNVELTDEMDGLSMYCYSRDCDIENASSKTKECRGLVYDRYGILVSKAFGYTPMYSTVTVPQPIVDFLSVDENLKKCKIYPSYEGCAVRAFNVGGKWYLTTHRKLDAFKSNWGCRTSFGQMFVDSLPSGLTLETFFEVLNPSRQYVFLILNTGENRIVCSPPQTPTSIHIGTFENAVMIEEHLPHFLTQTEIPNVENFHNLLTISDYTNPFVCQGVIVFLPDGTQVKICSQNYGALFNLRGNEASVMFRYLQIRMMYPEQYRLLYPEHVERFNLYENALMQVSAFILKSYQDRFILRQHVVVPQEEFKVMSQLHNLYKSNRKKITIVETQSVLNSQPPTALNKMIRRVLKSRDEGTRDEGTRDEDGPDVVDDTVV